jgi:chorismate mutase
MDAVTSRNASSPAASGANDVALEALAVLRASIDNLDAAVIHLLAERFKCTQKVGVLKAAHGMPASDPEREARQIERLHRLARDADLDPVFAERFLNFVIDEVIRHHRALTEGAGA